MRFILGQVGVRSEDHRRIKAELLAHRDDRGVRAPEPSEVVPQVRLILRQAVGQRDQIVELPSSQNPADDGVLAHPVGRDVFCRVPTRFTQSVELFVRHLLPPGTERHWLPGVILVCGEIDVDHLRSR